MLHRLLPLCCSPLLVFSVAHLHAAEIGKRNVPTPLPIHPGNIFLSGEPITIQLPGDRPWVLQDYEEKALGEFQPGPKVSVGKLPVGFYRFTSSVNPRWVSFAVLEPLKSPTPLTSPIGIDVAMAWFYEPVRMDLVASLCSLAGVNWVRDRLTWAEIEPEKGKFTTGTKYDLSASIQNSAGLQVLQVIHHSPPWANPNGKRFPLDLRDAFLFFEQMAKRWRGKVQAFEPWNEADIPMFGGHTGAEIASFQKASYLGLKAGNPEIIACLNVFAVHNTNQLSDFAENKPWAYMDTYNLHHYEPFDNYPALYRDHRAVSAGRPLWVSECAVPVKWAGDENLKEPTDADLKVQSERVAKTFASSIYEGSAATFYFLLPHYVEGQTQFGIIRPDLTPRPAYVALAAVGRLLADARPLGRVESEDQSLRAFLFKARPDGGQRNVLVAWSAKDSTQLTFAHAPEELFDHLGRSLESRKELSLTSAPVFAILSNETAAQLKTIAPPQPTPRLAGSPSPIVIQALWPEDKIDLRRSAYGISGTEEKIPIYLYNFGSTIARGQLQVETTSGWEAEFPASVELPPMGRIESILVLKTRSTASTNSGTVRIVGGFGEAGHALLSIRVAAR